MVTRRLGWALGFLGVTYYGIEPAVGSFSHLDEIFTGRLVHKAPAPSRLVRTAEPRVTWRFEGADLTLDDYSRAPRRPAC